MCPNQSTSKGTFCISFLSATVEEERERRAVCPVGRDSSYFLLRQSQRARLLSVRTWCKVESPPPPPPTSPEILVKCKVGSWEEDRQEAREREGALLVCVTSVLSTSDSTSHTRDTHARGSISRAPRVSFFFFSRQEQDQKDVLFS